MKYRMPLLDSLQVFQNDAVSDENSIYVLILLNNTSNHDNYNYAQTLKEPQIIIDSKKPNQKKSQITISGAADLVLVSPFEEFSY